MGYTSSKLLVEWHNLCRHTALLYMDEARPSVNTRLPMNEGSEWRKAYAHYIREVRKTYPIQSYRITWS